MAANAFPSSSSRSSPPRALPMAANISCLTASAKAEEDNGGSASAAELGVGEETFTAATGVGEETFTAVVGVGEGTFTAAMGVGEGVLTFAEPTGVGADAFAAPFVGVKPFEDAASGVKAFAAAGTGVGAFAASSPLPSPAEKYEGLPGSAVFSARDTPAAFSYIPILSFGFPEREPHPLRNKMPDIRPA